MGRIEEKEATERLCDFLRVSADLDILAALFSKYLAEQRSAGVRARRWPYWSESYLP